MKDPTINEPHPYELYRTSLLMALRTNMVLEVYICGWATYRDVSFIVADLMPHGIRVTVIKDCLGYQREGEHSEAKRYMMELCGVDITDSEGVINEDGGRPV